MKLVFLIPLSFVYWSSLFTLALVVFRQRLKEHWVPIVVSSAIMSLIANLAQSHFIAFGMALFQPVFTILCFYIIFRLRFLTALIISIIVYLADFTTEVVLYLIISDLFSENFFTLVRESVIMPAILLMAVNLTVSLILIKYRLGFSFVPFRTNSKEQMPPRFQKIILSLMIVGLLDVALTISSIYYWESKPFIFISILVVLLIGMLRYFYTEEMSDS